MTQNQSITWVELDHADLFGFKKLVLFKSEDNQFLKFFIDDNFDPILVMLRGSYIGLQCKKGEPFYFAVSHTDMPNVPLNKIMIEK